MPLVSQLTTPFGRARFSVQIAGIDDPLLVVSCSPLAIASAGCLPIVLSRFACKCDALWTWATASLANNGAREAGPRLIEVALMHERHRGPQVVYKLHDAVPLAYQAGDWDVRASEDYASEDYALETITVQPSKITRHVRAE